MKIIKHLLIFLSVYLISIEGFSQYSINARYPNPQILFSPGMSITRYRLTNYNSSVNLLFGFNATQKIYKRFDLKFGIQYSTRGSERINPFEKIRNDYLDFQIFPEYIVGEYLKIQFGVQYSYLINAKKKIVDGYSNSGYKTVGLSGYDNQLESVVGIEFPLQKNTTFGIKYTLPINNINYSNLQFNLNFSLSTLFGFNEKIYRDLGIALKNPQKVKRLVLNLGKINEVPPEITKFTNLKELVIKNNNLHSIPAEIGELKNLEKISFQFNKIDSIPKELFNLTKLNYLDLQYNNISKLPKEIGQLKNLEFLYLGHNKIEDIPSSIGNLSYLRYLYIGKNNIKSLPHEIGMLKNLIELNIAKSGILLQIPSEISLLRNLELLYIDKTTVIPYSIINTNPKLKIVKTDGLDYKQ